MKEWFLQDGHPEDAGEAWGRDKRMFIDDRLHKTADFVSSVEAETWLEARSELLDDSAIGMLGEDYERYRVCQWR
jgi:hypothetical protein